MFLDYPYSVSGYFICKAINTFAAERKRRYYYEKKIIISGSGVAGLIAANYLHSKGHEITVIDKAREFTIAGCLISLKSFCVKIMEELGLAENLRSASTPFDFMDFMDSGGNLIRRVSYALMNQDTNPPVVITRGGLHQVMYNSVKDKISVLFNTCVKQVQQHKQKLSITLTNGTVMDADLLIVSEGLRSATREKYFANSRLHDFNIFYMGGRLKENPGYKVGVSKSFIDVNKMLSIYPVSSGEVAIQCYIYNTETAAGLHSNVQRLLTQTFASYNPDVQQLFERFSANGQMYADKMGMIQASNLVNGRMVLLGDAGYCPTALSGMGASLSIYGAKALAHFIAQCPDDMPLALKNYNLLMQPIKEKFQGNACVNVQSFLAKDQATLQGFKSSFSTAPESALQQKPTSQLALTDDQLHFFI